MSVINATLDNFDKEVLAADKPVLVDFNADWCGPCRMLAPILHEIADERSDIAVAAVNVDDEPELAEKYDVSSIPCLVVIKNGAEAARHVGFINKDALNALIGG